mgnify:FL=1
MKIKFETIGGYPTPFVSNEEKASDEYGLQYFKTMYKDYQKTGESTYTAKRRRMENSRKYAEGIQDVSKYKDLLDVEGDTSFMNIDWTPVSIVPKFVDVIVGDLSNQDLEIKARAVDSASEQVRITEKNNLMLKMMNKDFLAELSQITRMDYNPKGFVPESSEELDLYMQLTYKQSHEIALEEGIKFVTQQNDFEETKRRVLRDLIVVGQGAVKTSICPSKGVKIKYVDPGNLITSNSASPSFENIQHAGEIYRVTIAELKQMAGSQFTDKEYKEIAEKYGKKISNTRYGIGFDASNSKYVSEYDEFSVEILDAEFMSNYYLKYEKKTNNFGGYSLNRRGLNQKVNENEKRQVVQNTVKAVYSGKYIVGSDYVFDYGLAKNMMRPKSDLSQTRLSYLVYAPHIRRGRNVSLVERMLPFADQIQLAHYKMQQLLAKARPKGAAFEIGSLENVSKGDGGNFTPLELQEIFDQTGNIYFRRTDDEGNQTQSMPIVELENGIGNDINKLIGIYQHNLQMIRDVTGVNEARDASKPSSDALVGVQKLSLAASNNATRFINQGYLNIIKRTGQSVCMRLQDLLKYSKPLKGYISALGDTTIKNIELSKDLSIHDFGIFIEVAPDAQEKQLLEQNIQVSLAQKELRLEDAIAIRSVINTKLANQMLVLRRKKYQEELMEQAKKNAENNAMQQQQSIQASSQAKQQEMQTQMQIEQSNAQIELQTKMQLLQAEFELKNNLAEAEHQRRMAELQVSGSVKEKANKALGSSREGSIEKSAYFQSQMIEQRKDKRGPIEDPDRILPEM